MGALDRKLKIQASSRKVQTSLDIKWNGSGVECQATL